MLLNDSVDLGRFEMHPVPQVGQIVIPRSDIKFVDPKPVSRVELQIWQVMFAIPEDEGRTLNKLFIDELLEKFPLVGKGLTKELVAKLSGRPPGRPPKRKRPKLKSKHPKL